jgi:Putative zinc- or iron-chelating domain
MADLPYRFEPAPGYTEYKVTTMLKDYLGVLTEQVENKETIEQILIFINNYIQQLRELGAVNRAATIKEVYKAIDNFFINAPEETKKNITCKSGCTACCFIDVDITKDEAAVIVQYCKENGIEIDRSYLINQASAGRKIYSDVSQCIFLKDNHCAIYPVRPSACRKHWVTSDPLFCDFSNNITNRINGHFDLNTEILASALLNAGESGSFEKILLNELG